ncbi:SDR family oxidoreductase [Antribacter sp. KLBMP9083]|uniref:SDR family oxidoreductase n=1 Tax=Antribacter soli TaxID=2910976 RepID=A0AA41U6I5_9MICO|nr:SDR family oxidoreductase [Antribacter soli]MCF4121078.1 SDR family oxidoreductase [Antribacter soli]
MVGPQAIGRLAGKIVVVTGAAGGQGAAIAVAAAREGARVVAVDVGEPGPELAPGLDDGELELRTLDVTDAAAWRSLADLLRDRHGRVDGLVNNAGITRRARLAEVTVEDFRLVHAVNVVGPLLGMQHLSPLMRSGGSIVNIGSVAARTAHFPVAYTSSKWALRGLSQAASLELGPAGIRVNLVHPGYIETPMTASASPAFRAANLAETPLGRSGTTADVARLVVFLLSDESSYVSGAEIPVDGGMTAHGGVKSISDAVRG